ncbi:signal peptidase II [Treponema brennaborense]|uniref:Lipoprotein signal peptidase n=1 Tax=Treponema brennaborense (strain DSM 12168 / CIP 105900 / DD5/3) TaxID=906968 RepID=F4LNE3_TREBD|nr:signal peptidase II [Treponema brennaborense]AEE17901.1 Lipoprotein signal peptidase [Treponema brennaborense DSM 12168]
MIDDVVPVEFVKNTGLKRKLIPLILTAAIFAADQLTKWLVVTFISPYTVGASFLNGFLRIVHVYNPGIAFSVGNGLPDTIRSVLFAFAPLAVLIVVMVVYFRTNEFSSVQRWAIAGIVGGGLGNLFDRFFRSEGVVDFIDVKFYGLFGLERWPTFNVADMSVLICGATLIISFIIMVKNESKSNRNTVKD